jgi:hypothetical protein
MPEWYRNTDWNDEIEAMFFDKLSRARSQRDQYIVIQALTLAASHPEVTLRLADFYFDTRTEDFHDDRARRAVTTAQFAMGGYAEALDNYLKILGGDEDAERDLYVGSPIEFAFLTARYRSAAHYVAALDQLSRITVPEEPAFDPRFRYLCASALLLAATGRDPARAVQDARTALDLPEVVTVQYPDLVWRLRGITRS